MSSEWKNGMLECCNIGDEGGSKNIIIIRNSFKLIIPLLHYSNWGEAPKFYLPFVI